MNTIWEIGLESPLELCTSLPKLVDEPDELDAAKCVDVVLMPTAVGFVGGGDRSDVIVFLVAAVGGGDVRPAGSGCVELREDEWVDAVVLFVDDAEVVMRSFTKQVDVTPEPSVASASLTTLEQSSFSLFAMDDVTNVSDENSIVVVIIIVILVDDREFR